MVKVNSSFDKVNGLIQVFFYINGKLVITGTVSNIVRILKVVVSGNMVSETYVSHNQSHSNKYHIMCM